MSAGALVEDLRGLLPHAGAMCLLDAVSSWDEERICCTTRTHCAVDNPLRRDGQLSAIHLCEYGAQAMAVHGGLLARRDGREPMTQGLLVAMRNVELRVDRVDDIPSALSVTARRLILGSSGFLYQFEVCAGARCLARGRLSVIQPA